MILIYVKQLGVEEVLDDYDMYLTKNVWIMNENKTKQQLRWMISRNIFYNGGFSHCF
jgi:hypothetical protein